MRPTPPLTAAGLRREAEARLQSQPAQEAPPSFTTSQRLLHELQVHQIELEMQNEQLREAQAESEALLARYTDLYESAPTGYSLLGPDGVIAETNLAGARLLGLERDRLTGEHFGTFVTKADLPVFNAFVQRVFASQINQTCEVNLAGEGQPHTSLWIEATRSPDGRDCRAVMVDITDRRQAESSLRLLEASLAQMNDAVIITEAAPLTAPGPRIVFVNAAAERMTGYTRAELIGQTPRLFQGARTDQDELRRIASALHQTGSVHAELINYKKAGTEYWMELEVAPVLSPAGDVTHFVAIERDITERKRAEELLRQSAAKTQRLLRAAAVGLWEWNLVTDAVYFSPEWKLLIGYADDEIANRFDEWQTRVHPDDLVRALAAVGDFCAGRAPRYSVEIRMLHRDGSWRWILGEADLERNDMGEPVAMMGSHIDITERKRAEEELRFSEERLRTIFDTSPECVKLVDADERLIDMNPAGLAMIEADSKNQVIGTPVLGLILAEHREAFQHLTKSVLQGNKASLEFEIEGLKGTRRWMETHAVPLTIRAGETVLLGITRDITRRKRMDEHMELAASVFSHTQEAIIITDAQNNIIDVNASFTEITGYSREEVLGKNPRLLKSGRHDTEFFIEMFRALHANGHWSGEKWNRHKDGHVFPTHATVTAVLDANRRIKNYLTVFSDITQSKRVEESLAVSELRLSRIVDSAMDAIITVDEQQHIVVFNAAAANMFGCSVTWAMGRSIDEFIPQRARGGHKAAMLAFGTEAAVSRSMTTRGVLMALHTDGSEFPISASISHTEVQGKQLYTVIVRDLSEQLAAEAIRGGLERQVREAQKMESLGTLAGGIAHDFNNILGAIRGNATLAIDDVGDTHPARQSLDEIAKAGRRAALLIEQILTFSRKQTEALTNQSMQPLVNEAAALLRATVPAGVTLEVKISGQPPHADVNATQISQVLVNLATNAWHSLCGRNGHISIALDEVALDAKATALLALKAGSYARIRVTDNGEGMTEATRARIFEPFFTTKAVGSGTGLGLAVVHGIIQSHGGAISVDSVTGKGSEFTVYLPAAAAASADAPSAAAPELVLMGEGRHVLYLDDDEAMVFLMERLLRARGFRVSAFEVADEAIAAVRANPTDFDLLVTDFNMPRASGIDVARAIREINPALPVVITSGVITDELRIGASETGVKQIIYKPNSVEELSDAIWNLLETKDG